MSIAPAYRKPPNNLLELDTLYANGLHDWHLRHPNDLIIECRICELHATSPATVYPSNCIGHVVVVWRPAYKISTCSSVTYGLAHN